MEIGARGLMFKIHKIISLTFIDPRTLQEPGKANFTDFQLVSILKFLPSIHILHIDSQFNETSNS